MRPGTILVMSSLLWGSGCASLQHPANTVTQWELAEVNTHLNHGAGGLEILDFCETRLECEERAQDLNAEADRPFALVTSEEVVP
jgi:hypothetical protein